MIVLGIESSCDETAAAIVREDGQVLADVVRSQVATHAPFGGVVPEIAARDHMRAIVPVVLEALGTAGLQLKDVDAVAVTHRPGLIGALLVGVQAAKGLAWAAERPLVGVDHLVGHLLSPFLVRDGVEASRPEFPFIGLLVSGGHSALYRCDGPAAEQIRELGATRDDAVGEAFDKVSKLLGLGYPGGPVIDRLAARGDRTRGLALTAPMAQRDSLELSFSGLKSAIARHVESHEVQGEDALADLCASFQDVVVGTLVRKTLCAARLEGVANVVIAGGVACNRQLRASMAEACAGRGLAFFAPHPRNCTDNAAMIAYAGAMKLARGVVSGLDLAPLTRTELPRVTRKGRGQR
ncbi:MAG: tRNA (adenosine(37)-N6)-threonylcarbamoyltransferase complex transferase subunit TsaD [Deltaproteobacteria bacterium]|nr:tRNA (adenosine(37)-N6)-threonylcarbamoyltransferase complex transferase subunit TsaD [Deltaproteobacteria bacterium]